MIPRRYLCLLGLGMDGGGGGARSVKEWMNGLGGGVGVRLGQDSLV